MGVDVLIRPTLWIDVVRHHHPQFRNRLHRLLYRIRGPERSARRVYSIGGLVTVLITIVCLVISKTFATGAITADTF